MKIRNPLALKLAGHAGAAGLRVLGRTLRYRFICEGEVTTPMPRIPRGKRYVYAVWHENLLLPTVRVGHPDLTGLVSGHADGRLLAGLLRAVGMGVVHGSTSRGGAEAVRDILRRAGELRHLVITPDGPRGPRRVLQGGAVYLASRTGRPLVPVGVGYADAWRLKSWDRFGIPRPGSFAVLVCAAPLNIPAGCRVAELERWTAAAQAALDRAQSLAEAWAATGVRPEFSTILSRVSS